MMCPVCDHRSFEEVFRHPRLPVFSALADKPFKERLRFDAVLHRCLSCGFVTQKITPTLERFLTSFYKEEASFFTTPPTPEAPGKRTLANIEALQKFVPKKVQRVLEIGAYDGYFLDLVRQKFKAREAIGIEIMRSINAYPHITLLHEVYPTPKLNGKTFDIIILMNVLEHVFTPLEFMRALWENLSDEGHVLIEIPNELYAFKTGMISYQHQHISYFTPTTIRRFLARVGFKVDLLQTGDKDRMLLVCSKVQRPTKTKYVTDMSAKGYAKRCAAVLAFCKKAITQRKLGLYGACTFTHNVIQMIETPSTLTIFDGDERKEGKYMSGIAKPVHSWRDIDSSGVAGVLIMPLGFTKEIVAFLRTKGYSRKLEPLFKNLR